MARPRKEIKQKEFENLCRHRGLQFSIANYADYAEFEVGRIIRICLRTGKIDEARELMNELVFEYD